MVAVDPRGAVLLAGGGEHGVTRLRLRRDTDPTFRLMSIGLVVSFIMLACLQTGWVILILRHVHLVTVLVGMDTICSD